MPDSGLVIYFVGAVIFGITTPLILLKTESHDTESPASYFLLAVMGATSGAIWPVMLGLTVLAGFIRFLDRKVLR